MSWPTNGVKRARLILVLCGIGTIVGVIAADVYAWTSAETGVSVTTGVPAVSTSLTVTIAMTLPPGTMPGTSSGGIPFDVVPVTGP